MRGSRTALGIDISNNRINLALLRRSAKGIRLVKAASGAVPDGAIKDGNIENPALLAGAIKKLKAASRIHSHPVAMSLIATPVLVQILDLPKDRPSNVRTFVHDEVKHYAVLPMKKTAVDFRGIVNRGKSDGRQVLVVATDERRVTDCAGALANKGLSIAAIEPAWLAYIRACYAKKIANTFDTNLLFAVVHNSTVILCLFRNETLDFVRTKQLEPAALSSCGYSEWLSEEIDAIVRFYEFEVSGKPNKWKVTLVVDVGSDSFEKEVEQLKTRLDAVELEVATISSSCIETPVANTKKGIEASVVAVGLAMKILCVSDLDLGVNLLPSKVTEAKAIEKQVLISANIAAFIFVLIILAAAFFDAKIQKAGGQIRNRRKMLAGKNIVAVKDEQMSLNGEFAIVSAKLERLKGVLSTGGFLKWSEVLKDTGMATPQGVQITELSCQDSSVMSLQGRSLSHEDIQLFVDMLNECEHVDSASLIRTEKEPEPEGSIRYVINCSLVQRKGFQE
ncbi:MAG: pilus assembly protein PilM [Sedimentisphaerales bacterium]|nr:pilus assembly protein PilM [Sedimentisphaerales bacterium]